MYLFHYATSTATSKRVLWLSNPDRLDPQRLQEWDDEVESDFHSAAVTLQVFARRVLAKVQETRDREYRLWMRMQVWSKVALVCAHAMAGVTVFVAGWQLWGTGALGGGCVGAVLG